MDLPPYDPRKIKVGQGIPRPQGYHTSAILDGDVLVDDDGTHGTKRSTAIILKPRPENELSQRVSISLTKLHNALNYIRGITPEQRIARWRSKDAPQPSLVEGIARFGIRQ